MGADDAMDEGVAPSCLVGLFDGPASHSNLAISKCPFCDPLNKGVAPSWLAELFDASASQPGWPNNSTHHKKRSSHTPPTCKRQYSNVEAMCISQ